MSRLPAAAAVAAACLVLTGCASTVALEPAPDATSAACASVVVGLPQTIAQADRRNTDAQGTAAWGTPASVTLRCGVETPDASALPCTTVEGVDWLLQDRGDDRVLTTYGRTPGVQVLTTPETSANDALQALSAAVADGTRGTQRECLSDSGSTASPGASLAPTPSAAP